MPEHGASRPQTISPTRDLQKLPSVDQVLRTPAAVLGIERFGRTAVVEAIRATLASARASGHVAAMDEAAIDAAVAAMRSAVALEFNIASGRRGERDDHVRELLCELTGAEDATV